MILDGAKTAELFIMTRMDYYIDWLKRELNKSLKSESTDKATIT